jgi:hypothetical protein
MFALTPYAKQQLGLYSANMSQELTATHCATAAARAAQPGRRLPASGFGCLAALSRCCCMARGNLVGAITPNSDDVYLPVAQQVLAHCLPATRLPRVNQCNLAATVCEVYTIAAGMCTRHYNLYIVEWYTYVRAADRACVGSARMPARDTGRHSVSCRMSMTYAAETPTKLKSVSFKLHISSSAPSIV